MNHVTFLREAIELAEKNSTDGTGGPFGAIIVRDGEIVGRGGNRVVEDRDPTAHAEILAIRDASERLGTHILEGCTIYCSCEPCPMCLSAIYWAHIPQVVFAASGEEAKGAGFDDTFIKRELGLAWPDRSILAVRALPEEGARVLRFWGKNPDRIEY